MSPKEESDKQRTILAAARELLVARGFQDVALDDVAKKAGVAKGTLFLYYKSKDELFRAAFADLVDQLGEELEKIAGRPLQGRGWIDEAVRAVLEHFDANKDFMAQFGAGRFPGCGDKSCEALMERMRLNVDRMVRLLRKAAADGAIATRDYEAAAAALFGLCRSSILYKHLKPSTRPLAARRDQVVEMFLYGVAKR